MPETIYKLQPDRTVHLRGFDHLGAGAAVHGATPAGFSVSGVFRDPSDFAVVVLWDADNFFEHPRLKYLPDFSFSGLTLTFDVQTAGLMPFHCRKYPSIDWAYLDVTLADGAALKVPLAEHATVIGEGDLPASAQFHILGSALNAWDRLTLWYQNLAFDYIVPGPVRTTRSFYAGTPGTTHSIVVADRGYAYVEQDGDTTAAVTAHLIGLVNGTEGGGSPDPEVAASAGGNVWEVVLATKLDTGGTVFVGGSGAPVETLYHIQATTVCRELCDQINGANYGAAQTPFSLAAEAAGTLLNITTVEAGYDADFIGMYAIWKTETLRTQETEVHFSGGASDAPLRIQLDFASLGASQIRKMWLTLAPRLANGRDYEAQEWQASFSNWTVSGPEEVRRLQVAGPGSARVSSLDADCAWTGAWTDIEGFYMNNAARQAGSSGASVALHYHCEQPHELWLGTELAAGRGSVNVTVDGGARPAVDLNANDGEVIVTRRQLAASVAAGDHVVTLTAQQPGFVFDFLEAAVRGDVPDPVPVEPRVAPALDYSTDHTYKLPPARILWMLEKLGFTGPLNQYIGVFWWNQRKAVGGDRPAVTLEFSGSFSGGDQVLVTIGEQVCGKSVFPADTLATIANHFALLINATYVGVWAEAQENRLTIHARSSAPTYTYEVEGHADSATGEVTGGGTLGGGTMPEWQVDPSALEPLNRGARDWHADFYGQVAAAGREVTTACSMELVLPPPEFAACFADSSPVITDVGFGGLHSTHCAFRNDVLAFQTAVYQSLAALMAEAGLTPSLQFGEFTWWYFSRNGGMAYYDAETAAAAQAALGRPLHVFTGPDDDPSVNGGADATFLRNRLRDHVASLATAIRESQPGARLEILFPYDVNYPVPSGAGGLGGRLNRYVNLPPEWGTPQTSGLDRFRLEMLNFGAWSRDLGLVRTCLGLPLDLGWAADDVRLMTPVFRGGYPWYLEVERALELGFQAINLWAFDHICLFALDLQDGAARRALRQG